MAGKAIFAIAFLAVCVCLAFGQNDYMPIQMPVERHDHHRPPHGCDTHTKGWSSWSSWGECSASCGGGLKTRTRECCSSYHHCYKEHENSGYEHEQKESCNYHECEEYYEPPYDYDPKEPPQGTTVWWKVCAIVGGLVASIVGMAMIMAACCFYEKRRKSKKAATVIEKTPGRLPPSYPTMVINEKALEAGVILGVPHEVK